jgi:fatty-acyl-CoA synthase
VETIRSSTVGAAFDEIAEKYPEKEAIVFQDQRITYRLLQERANCFAKGLLRLGVKKDDKVAVWMPNNLEWVYAFLGSAKAGTVFVSVNSRFKTHELEYVLSQSDCTTVVFQDRLYKTDYLEMFQQLCPEVVSCSPGGLRSPKFPLLNNVICRTGSAWPGIFTFEEMMALGAREITDEELCHRQESVAPDDLLMLQYTSGTTSFPKGCMSAHLPVIQDILAMGKNMVVDSNDRFYCPLPFNHVGGSLITLLMALLTGATVVTEEHFDPEAGLSIIQRERCTVMNGVETIWVEMLKHPSFDRFDLTTLKKGWAIGPPELLRSVAEKMGVRRFVNTYGLSEQTANTGTTQADDPLEFKIRWNGRPHPDSEMKIIDLETGETLKPGEQGEICVRGFNVMKGYYKMPVETAKTIDHEGWLRTGDLGVMDAKGNFRFVGRAKDLLRVGGENVSAIEVEGFLLQHPAVRQVQLIGVPDPKLVEVPMAVVQLKDGHSCREQEIIDFCRGKLSSFKIPRHVRFVKEFPQTASGKVQKYKLREDARKALEKNTQDNC